MTEEKQSKRKSPTGRRIVAALDDIWIVFECSACGGELAFYTGGEEPGKIELQRIENCPACAKPWNADASTRHLFASLLEYSRTGTLPATLATPSTSPEKKALFTVKIHFRDPREKTLL